MGCSASTGNPQKNKGDTQSSRREDYSPNDKKKRRILDNDDCCSEDSVRSNDSMKTETQSTGASHTPALTTRQQGRCRQSVSGSRSFSGGGKVGPLGRSISPTKCVSAGNSGSHSGIIPLSVNTTNLMEEEDGDEEQSPMNLSNNKMSGGAKSKRTKDSDSFSHSQSYHDYDREVDPLEFESVSSDMDAEEDDPNLISLSKSQIPEFAADDSITALPHPKRGDSRINSVSAGDKAGLTHSGKHSTTRSETQQSVGPPGGSSWSTFPENNKGPNSMNMNDSTSLLPSPMAAPDTQEN